MTLKEDRELSSACELIDKLSLKYLHLMEDKINCELKIEHNINNGSIQLAKSRYIMGQNSVGATQLPAEGCPEFSASTVCVEDDQNGIKLLKVAEATEKTVNPIHWFGVLVPQNLQLAKSIFQRAIDLVIECANIQLLLAGIEKHVKILNVFKVLKNNG